MVYTCTDELCVHTYVYCYTYSACMYWHISTSHSDWGDILALLLKNTFTFVLHVCTIAMDLLNTNVNSVKYMPAANAHTLMHVHTLTLSHTCAHKAHTRTYMRCFLPCPLPPRTAGETDQPCCVCPQHCGEQRSSTPSQTSPSRLMSWSRPASGTSSRPSKNQNW